jgi:subtilisin family serine protease
MGLNGYFILEHDIPEAPATRSGRFGEGFGVRTMGPGAAKSQQPPVKVSTAELTAAEAATERKRAGVRVVGRKMPIRLIAPLADPAAGGGAKGGAAKGGAAKGGGGAPPSWGVTATGADDSPFDGSGVTVAVLDTGIARDHPAFAGVDLLVRDFTDAAGKGEDTHGHGSHCAGTIFGRDVGGRRIGIAPGVGRALIGKVIPDEGGGDSGMLFDALNWASGNGANIVSMSLGFDFPGMVEQLVQGDGLPQQLAVSNALVVFGQNLRAFDAIMAMFRASEPMGRNMLVVGAAGNESRHDAGADYRISASLPSAAAGVISVAAYGRKGENFEMAPFSNGDALIAAPGVDIVSADIVGGLTMMSGTSQACPHIAGLAALYWQQIAFSGATPTPDKVREAMFAAATLQNLPVDADESVRGRGRALAPKGN